MNDVRLHVILDNMLQTQYLCILCFFHVISHNIDHCFQCLLRRGGEEPSGESFPGVRHCIQRILTDDKLYINQA